MGVRADVRLVEGYVSYGMIQLAKVGRVMFINHGKSRLWDAAGYIKVLRRCDLGTHDGQKQD